MMMFRSFLLQALFGGDGGRSTKDSGGGGGGGINTTGNTSTAFPKGVGADEMNSSFPSFSSPSTPSSYSKRKKVVLLVFFCILFGGIFFLFGAFEIVRGMTTMSSSASLGESSIQQQMVYKRSDERNRGWKGEDEEGDKRKEESGACALFNLRIRGNDPRNFLSSFAHRSRRGENEKDGTRGVPLPVLDGGEPVSYTHLTLPTILLV